jgi:hypothetical protein
MQQPAHPRTVKGAVMAVHQCPQCVLRFSFRTEVEAHLATDHHTRPSESTKPTKPTKQPAVAAAGPPRPR